MTTTLRLTYYPDITQKQQPEAVHAAVEVFARALTDELQRMTSQSMQITVSPVLAVKQQYDDILANSSTFALMKPVAYVFAHGVNPDIVPASVAHRAIDGKVGAFYYGQVYARRNLGFKSLSDVLSHGAGKLRMAYGDRFSTSNFLIPAASMQSAGIHPFLHFAQIRFAGGHDLAAEAVYRNDADLGAGHDGVIKILAQSQPDAERELVQLARENIHSDPVVVNLSTLPSWLILSTIQAACRTVAQMRPVQEALELFWGEVKDLGDTQHSDYASIERALQQLHLTPADMIS
jgi:phosphonate transport system substrate-binding protein